MKTILIGIQPTGRLHLGHYLGVIKPAIELDKQGELIEFMVADYHALTTQKEVNAGNLFDILHKFGFNNINYQDRKAPELFWKMIAQEPIGNLKHLPQFKSKEKTLGMLTYPVLMACDIILSKCDAVLVGEDQLPHMEYYRYLARKHDYKVAETIIVPSSKVMSIKDPTKKMSKSLGDEHCIYLDDTLEGIKSKIKKAPTTPKGLTQLKKLSKIFGITYNSKENAKSKEQLAVSIYNTIARQ